MKRETEAILYSKTEIQSRHYWSPDERFLALFDSNMLMHLICFEQDSVHEGLLDNEIRVHSSLSAAFSPCSGYIAVISDEGFINIFKSNEKGFILSAITIKIST